MPSGIKELEGRSMRSYATLLVCLFLLFIIFGCAQIKEAARGFAGTSTKVLEDNRSQALKQNFHYSYNVCYAKIKTVLKEKGSYIYREDAKQQLIAAYLSSDDATPVGLFLKRVDDNNTLVEVSSPSTYAKEVIFKYLISGL